jgi:uncharacterized integral membrane protein
MKLGYLVVAVLAVTITIFALQNTAQIAIRFALWRLDGVPIAGLVLGSLGAGLLLAGLPLWIKMGIWRSRARSLQTRLGALDAPADQTRHPPDLTSSRAPGSSEP